MSAILWRRVVRVTVSIDGNAPVGKHNVWPTHDAPIVRLTNLELRHRTSQAAGLETAQKSKLPIRFYSDTGVGTCSRGNRLTRNRLLTRKRFEEVANEVLVNAIMASLVVVGE